MGYRTEIDGLRAIAVLAVILFHSHFNFISGGYAGVDVFFVISGYLIGGQILKELEMGSFSYWSFYSRRARRILPALFTVILSTAAVGYFVLLPNDYRYFYGAAFTSLLSLSNFWFMEQIDYFNPQAALDPLVHTWSLGVEEQFYLFVPLMLSAAWLWFRRFLTLFIALVTIASVMLVLILTETNPMFSFYMLPTRAWELLTGILVAIGIGKPWWTACQGRHAQLALVGLFMLLGGLVFTPPAVAWPGHWTFLPVSGTALILLFGQASSTTRQFLSLPPMRFVGIISYSAYLWHQPILSFLAYSERAPISLAEKATVILLVFALAALSWRFVEQPFRRGFAARRLGKGLLTGSALVIVALSLGGHFTKGYPFRAPPNINEFLINAQMTGPYNKPCLLSRADVAEMDLNKSCILGADVPPTVALWGDSHSAAIFDSMGEVMAAKGRSLQAFMLASCLPVPQLINHGQTRADQCPAFNASVLEHILAHNSIEYVILFATWDNYILNGSFPNMLGYSAADGFYSYPEHASENMPEQDRLAGLQKATSQLIRTLTEAGKTVVFVQSLPRPNVDVPRNFARIAWAGGDIPKNSGYDIRHFMKQSEEGRRLIAAVERETDGDKDALVIVDPSKTLCDDEQCYVIKDGSVLFLDGNHPSLDGASLLAPQIAAAIKPK